MINNALSDYSDMSDDFEFEKDEEEVTIRPYEVDCLPNDYFAMNYRMEIVEDKDEGGFVVSFPELPGCITCGETVESAVANALDAKKAWLEAAIEDGIEIHEPDSLEEYSGQFKLRIPRSLHRSLAEHSKREGISMNQYCVYLLSKNDAVYSKQQLQTAVSITIMK